MPPLSKTLAEEGAAIIAFKLVENGVFQEQGMYSHIYICMYVYIYI
jgi:N-methylhydantoinase B/oxoprolinase/acetone carboxylase alpha subunit